MSQYSIMIVLVLGTSIWAAIDASKIGAGKVASNNWSVNTSPVQWFFLCVLLWIVFFPLYLVKRSGIRKAVIASQGTRQPGSVLPAAGWYADESGVNSKADELVKLDALRQSGVLSQAEFDAEKAKVLGAPLSPPTHPA